MFDHCHFRTCMLPILFPSVQKMGRISLLNWSLMEPHGMKCVGVVRQKESYFIAKLVSREDLQCVAVYVAM